MTRPPRYTPPGLVPVLIAVSALLLAVSALLLASADDAAGTELPEPLPTYTPGPTTSPPPEDYREGDDEPAPPGWPLEDPPLPEPLAPPAEPAPAPPSFTG